MKGRGKGEKANQDGNCGSRIYTGRRYDSETGLYYYRARYYDSEIGRFLQKDPLTWGPDDRRILTKSTSLREVLLPFLGANITSDIQKKNIEQNFYLTQQFKLPPEYFANPRGELIVNSKTVRSAVLGIGLLYPQLSSSYNYCFNNPINYIDPDGEIVVWMAITAGVVIVSILAHQAAYYLGKLDKCPGANPEEPGPPIQPYRPSNPYQQQYIPPWGK